MSSIFNRVVSEYKAQALQREKVYEDSLLGEVQKIKDALLEEKFKPSFELKKILNRQIKRAVYPMEVAIVGQFSSGKSTFLNALLSRDILPTGITPVTSKVIYINYGESYKLRITYKSGVHEYRPIEELSLFSDQRVKHLAAIKYLSVYAPVERLKTISFVDTPGLNSPSQEDTESTKKVFQDVGGIIWLTLMDNAGKRSEKEILERYMPAFKSKSLCLLNQMDKFSLEQRVETTSYIEKKFSSYFSKVIPISAKMALDARALKPAVRINDAMNHLIQDFRKGLEENPQCTTLQFFSDDFTNFKLEVKSIRSLDTSALEEQIEASHINEVLAYIEEVMSPNATEMKAFRIKNDLKNICDILMNSYHTMAAVYDALSTTLTRSEVKTLEKLTEIDSQYSSELIQIHQIFELLFQELAGEIDASISEQEKVEYKTSISGFLKQEKIEKFGYETFAIDKHAVMDRLFFNEQRVEVKFKKICKQLEAFESNVHKDLFTIYKVLEDDVCLWQQKYLLLSKNREISSDHEFSQVKRFASKVYENILNTYYRAMLVQTDSFNIKIAYLKGLLSNAFSSTVQMSMLEIEEKILASEAVYLKDPSTFSIYRPHQDEIVDTLKRHFDFEKLDEMLITPNAFLHRVIKESKKNMKEITLEKRVFIENEKAPFLKKREDLARIKARI